MRGMTEPRPDHLPSSLPFSQACENNQAPILAVLQQAFADRRQVLEVGSGTGQHGVYFAPRLPHLVWQTSDLAENHPGIRAWQAAHPAPNLRAPLLLDLAGSDWPGGPFDAVFSANTTHIVAWPLVHLLPLSTPMQGVLLLYAALPPAVMNYIFADRYQQEPGLVSAIVVVGNIASIFFVPYSLYLAL